MTSDHQPLILLDPGVHGSLGGHLDPDRVVLVLGRTLKPGTPEPSIFLPWTGPGQASGGALDCQSRPWPPSLMQEQLAKAGRMLVEYAPGRRPAMCTPCGDSMVLVRVSSERVVVGILGSEMVAMVSANQDRVVCRATALPLAEGHSWQVFLPVRVI